MRQRAASNGFWLQRAISSCRRLAVELAIAGLVLLGAPAAGVAGDDQGIQIAAACASCHDLSASEQGIPPVAGLDEQTIVRAIQAYRASERPNHVMHAVALSLTDEEVASVAHYLAMLPGKASSP
jgi:cytochrome c553